MARPIKDGIDYFSFDIDFFIDDKVKLIRSEFGPKGLIIFIYLLCEIYRGDGYFKAWNDDSCILTSDGVACGCTPAFISQVVQRFVKRSLFSETLFNKYKILTSPGIQRRYLRACSTRDEIRIRQEYWLLNAEDKKDVPAGILKKITFFSNDLQNNSVNLQNNPQNLQIKTQSKLKESKLKEKRECGVSAPPRTPAFDDVKEYCTGKNVDPERFFNYYEAIGWVTTSGIPIKNWRALVNNWNRTESIKKTDEPKYDTTYDLEEIEKLNAFD